MVKKRYTPRRRVDPSKHLATQKFHMKRHFPCFECSLQNGVLECVGEITPCEECATYKIRIRLRRGFTPKVRVLEPKVQPSSKIHTFSNGDLCLYDHRKHPWMTDDNLHEKIVPWTAEWLVYYELFLMTGEWLGPEAPHGETAKAEQKNQKGSNE